MVAFSFVVPGDRSWPNAPADQPRLNGRYLDIAAIFGVHVTGSRGRVPPFQAWKSTVWGPSPARLGIGSNLNPASIERATSDDFSGVSFAGAWPFGGRLVLAATLCNLLYDHWRTMGKLGDEVELPAHRFDIAFEG